MIDAILLLIAGPFILIVASLALVLLICFTIASMIVSFVRENILPLSAMAAAYILVRYFGL